MAFWRLKDGRTPSLRLAQTPYSPGIMLEIGDAGVHSRWTLIRSRRQNGAKCNCITRWLQFHPLVEEVGRVVVEIVLTALALKRLAPLKPASTRYFF